MKIKIPIFIISLLILVVGCIATAHATGTYNFTTDNISINESSPSINITIQRSDSSEAGSVDYATFNGTAKSGDKYTYTSGTANFDIGVSSINITIPIKGNNSYDGNTFFFLNLSNPINGSLNNPYSIMITIIENTSMPILSINSTTISESSSYVNVYVNITGSRSIPVFVNYYTIVILILLFIW